VDEILDRAPCGFLSFADDGAIGEVNATLLDLLGYERGELAGKHVETLLTVGSRIFYQTHFFPLVRLHGRADEIFLILKPKGGGDVGVLVNALRRERGGASVIDCVLMHVQERRKYEDALLQAKRAAEEASAALEARGRELQEANETLESQAMELELQHQRLQEQTVELEAQQDALQTANEELQVHAEALEQQRAVAEEANRAKSSFLAVMSHELRTPLNAIGGYVQLIELGVYGPVSTEQREPLARIARSQRHLLGLINDVLNLSRIEAGRVEYAIEDVPVVEIASHVLPMIEPQLAAKQLRSEVRIPPDLVARADREKVQQILLNLLTNAMKFTPAGGEVVVEASPGRDGIALVRVRDSGIGIPAEMLERVFEAFVQVDATHTRASEGTGLGLAISRDLARGMGGDLRAESEVGRGSTFILSLPRAG
jgi:PAS domain S-box-containing protein